MIKDNKTLAAETCVLAIGRAEKALADACLKFEQQHKVTLKKVMLVNESFTKSDEYFGDESQGAFEIIVVNFDDESSLLNCTKYLNKFNLIAHCRYEPCIQDYARVIPYLDTKYVQSPASLKLSTIKSEMRKAFLSSYPEISPRYIKINKKEDVNPPTLSSFTFPVIVKPIGLNSSWLVTKCDTYDKLKKTIDESFDKVDKIYNKFYGVGEKAFVIEEFITGKMYTIDSYVNNEGELSHLPPTRVITSNEMGKDGFYCYRSMTQTFLTNQEVRTGNICVEKAVSAVGLRNSTVHAELYLTKNGWKVIEIGPRIGGGKQFLYKEAYGIDHFYNDLLIHAGLEPDTTILHTRYASGFCMYAEKEGLITSITGIEDVRNLSSLKRLHIAVKPGEQAVFASNGGRYVLDGNLSNDQSEQLDDDFETIVKTIKINVAP